MTVSRKDECAAPACVGSTYSIEYALKKPSVQGVISNIFTAGSLFPVSSLQRHKKAGSIFGAEEYRQFTD